MLRALVQLALMLPVPGAGDQPEDVDDLRFVRIPVDAEERPESYFPSATVSTKRGYYVDGECVGERYFYRQNGMIAEEKLLRNGVPHGVWRQFYANGHLFAERPHRDGKPHGTFRFYSEDGRLLGKSILRDGTGTLREFRYTDLGAQDREIPYVDGKIEGDVRTWGRYARYRSDGVQDETVDGVHLAEYSAGQMNGWSTTYDADGRLIRSGYRQGDRAHGVIRNYDVEGQQVRGWPKYFVRDMEVSHDAYVRAAQIDPVLKISLDKDRPDEAPDLTRPQS